MSTTNHPARRQWRYIRWARALHHGSRLRANVLDLAQKCDGPGYPIAARVLDHVAGAIAHAEVLAVRLRIARGEE